MYILPALFLLITFCGAGSPKNEPPASFPDLKQSRFIRASACLGVILHHLSQVITGYGTYQRGLLNIFSEGGFLFTAVFFFFSGFGLITSVYNKPDYLRTFLQRRLPAVLIPFWFANACVLVLNITINKVHYGMSDIIRYLTGLRLINGNGWFIVEIVILYLIFFTLFCIIKNKDIALVLLCTSVILIIAWSFTRGHDDPAQQIHWFRGEWWYNSTAAFAAGLLYARFRIRRPAAVSTGSGRPLISLTAAGAVFAAIFYTAVRVNHRFGYYQESLPIGTRYKLITLAAQTAACLAFLIFVLLLMRCLVFGNRILRFTDRISLMLFLLHGFFVEEMSALIRKSPVPWSFIVIILSIAAAAAAAPAARFLVRKTTSLLLKPGKQKFASQSEDVERLKKIRARRKRRAAAAAGAVLLALILYFTVGKDLLMQREFRKECEALQSAEPGDVIFWGRFDTDGAKMGRERMKWIVLEKEDGQLLLISEKGIAGSSYHRKHEPVFWKDSDLRAMLNGPEYMKMFSSYEEERVLDNGGDRITLLTAEEADRYFASDEERELAITAAAEARGTNTNKLSKFHRWDMKGYRSSWWWLRGTGDEADVMAPIVTVDGGISEHEKEVNKPGGAVRPVIRIKL